MNGVEIGNGYSDTTRREEEAEVAQMLPRSFSRSLSHQMVPGTTPTTCNLRQ